MKREEIPINLARRISHRALIKYAESLDWRRVQGIEVDIALFHEPDRREHQIIIPLDEQFDDYGERVIDVISRLADFEKRPALEILNLLLVPSADILRFREISNEAESGNLPLDHAVRMIDGTRKLLLSVAHSVLVPRPYHPRLSRSEAEEFVSRCRLGQTERGSYVLSVVCPLDLSAGFSRPDRDPFARQVTDLFIKTLNDLSLAADGAGIDDLTDLSIHPGISANFCESLLAIQPTGDQSYVNVSVVWSRYLPRENGEGKREVRLGFEIFDIAAKLGPLLRTFPKPSIAENYFGYVDELRGQPSRLDSRPEGEVRLSLFDREEEFRARADLRADDYEEAAKAHLNSRLVFIKGVLERLPRLNRLRDVSEFEIVPIEEFIQADDDVNHSA